ncbi:MAG: hypothetical protein HKO93_07255 [Flavobacteriales bacterium]|nr:hypothetical protein [Flavobacteriales bacterium]
MDRRLNIISISLVLLMIGGTLKSQYYRNQAYWKKDRISLFAGVGASNFLGELGGRDQIGSDFIWDLDTQAFKPALTVGVKYVTGRNSSIRAQFSYAVIAGDDALTSETFRFNRNLHFRSNVLEFSVIGEYVLYSIRPTARYNLTGTRGIGPKSSNIYGFLGIGGMTFNPQGKVGDDWYDLRPFGTEGQNIEEGLEPYSLFTMVVPLGIGFRKKMFLPDLMVGIEIGHRITFTDYIDDVSTEYYDQEALLTQPDLTVSEGLLAAYFADPSLGYLIDDSGQQVPLNNTFPGAQRGDPEDNDAYLFVQATLQYKIAKRRYKKQRFNTKKGKRIVF